MDLKLGVWYANNYLVNIKDHTVFFANIILVMSGTRANFQIPAWTVESKWSGGVGSLTLGYNACYLTV